MYGTQLVGTRDLAMRRSAGGAGVTVNVALPAQNFLENIASLQEKKVSPSHLVNVPPHTTFPRILGTPQSNGTLETNQN